MPSTYIGRLREEIIQLKKRTEKLENFIENNSIFQELSAHKQVLMQLQLTYMLSYLNILNQRFQLEDK
jgi:hypothetical protein